ncbi:hypothetical protein ACIQWN_32440 [Streptomyces vinaceus]
MASTLLVDVDGLVVRCTTRRYEAADRLAVLIRTVWRGHVMIRVADDGTT